MSIENQSTLFGSISPSWGRNGYESGPANHRARGRGNWASDHAWDIFAPEGTPVYAIAPGVVIKVRASNPPTPETKVYGDQVSVRGKENHPDVFYTHITSLVRTGQELNVGDLIGTILQHGANSQMPTHVHIGIAENVNISNFVDIGGSLLLHNKNSNDTNTWENLITTMTEWDNNKPTNYNGSNNEYLKLIYEKIKQSEVMANIEDTLRNIAKSDFLRPYLESSVKNKKYKKGNPFGRSNSIWTEREK